MCPGCGWQIYSTPVSQSSETAVLTGKVCWWDSKFLLYIHVWLKMFNKDAVNFWFCFGGQTCIYENVIRFPNSRKRIKQLDLALIGWCGKPPLSRITSFELKRLLLSANQGPGLWWFIPHIHSIKISFTELYLFVQNHDEKKTPFLWWAIGLLNTKSRLLENLGPTLWLIFQSVM